MPRESHSGRTCKDYLNTTDNAAGEAEYWSGKIQTT